ncbi:MAG: hypothetical protein Q8R24_10855, partial [Legionellaceae bacterium]|nr:hypothetical protein [Legionellaceae bacterium]
LAHLERKRFRKMLIPAFAGTGQAHVCCAFSKPLSFNMHSNLTVLRASTAPSEQLRFFDNWTLDKKT